jgi:hypothetical protein
LQNDGIATQSVNLSAFVNTDNQDLALAGNTLSLTNDGTTVNLAPYLDNTDNQTLTYVGNTLTISNGNSVTIPNGDITGVTAGDGLTGGGTTGNVTLNVVATNGLTDNANDVRLGGTLIQATTITQGANTMTYNLNGTGDFNVQDNGVTQFSVQDNGDVRADNATFYVDASTDRVGVGTTAPGEKLHVVGDILLTGAVRNIETQDGDQNIQLDDANPIWNGQTYGGVTRFFGDGTLANSKLEAGGLQLERRIQIKGGNPAAGRVLTSDATGNATWQAPTVGDITGVTAGTGLTGGGTAGTVTVNAVGTNGLNTTANDIRLGGTLIQATTITQGTNNMTFNLNSTGDFHIQDNGTNHFSVTDNGNTAFGGDVEWRDENTGGTILAQLFDDGDDGRFIIRENGGVSVDLDANTQFIFNEQGFDRNFRIESDANANMLFLDAGLNRLSVGTNTSAGTFNVLGTSYHSDDIYLRDGAVNGGDVLVRIFDSADDGIIDVYENNVLNHRIHGNGVSIFNEQGNNNADMRMESDLNANMFFLDAGTNRLSIGTNTSAGTFNVLGTSYHSDDIYLRDGAVNGGDVLVRIFDSADDGIIDVYENNAMNHRIHGNGTTVFNEQGNNNADIRIETDTKTYGFFVDASENNVGVGTVNLDRSFHVAHDQFTGGGGFGGLEIEQTFNNAQWTLYSSQSTSNLSLYLNNALRGAFDDASGAYTSTSDVRLKKNIENLQPAMDGLMKLRPTMYHYKTQSDEEAKIAGFIAQEVKEIFPTVVKIQEDDTNGTSEISDVHLMSYTELLPFMVKGMQEQQNTIETLKKELKDIKALLKSANK